jgi:hypothetical protein
VFVAAPANWRLLWSCTPEVSVTDAAYSLIVMLYYGPSFASTQEMIDAPTCMAGSNQGVVSEHDVTGRMYLQALAHGSGTWNVTVEVPAVV